MRLPISTASGIECVTNSTVKRVSSHSCSSSSCILRRVSASSAANGSSISRMSGSIAMRAGDRDALLHAARQRVRIGVGELGEVDLVDVVHGLRLGGLAAHLAATAASANITFCFTVFQGRSWSNSWNTNMRSGPGPADRRALEPHVALGRRHVAADGLEQRRLAAARRTEQHEAVGRDRRRS